MWNLKPTTSCISISSEYHVTGKCNKTIIQKVNPLMRWLVLWYSQQLTFHLIRETFQHPLTDWGHLLYPDNVLYWIWWWLDISSNHISRLTWKYPIRCNNKLITEIVAAFCFSVKRWIDSLTRGWIVKTDFLIQVTISALYSLTELEITWM